MGDLIDLNESAQKEGFRLIYKCKVNCKDKDKAETFILTCSRYQIYRKYKKKKEGNLCRIVLHNQKRVNRGPSGRSKVRRSSTRLPLCKDARCKLMITIAIDKKTSHYYMKGGLGCALHNHHAKENRVTWHGGVYSNELKKQVEKVKK